MAEPLLPNPLPAKGGTEAARGAVEEVQRYYQIAGITLGLSADVEITDETWIFWQSRALDSTGAAARHLVERAITPGIHDWEWVELAPRLRSLYDVVRPVRMAVRYARRGAQV